jgi:hypothetical protein
LVPAALDVDAPEKALQAASLVNAKNDEAEAVNVSVPLVNVKSVMYGEGGNLTPLLPMKNPALARQAVKSRLGRVLVGQSTRLTATIPSVVMYPLANPAGAAPNAAVSQLV